MFNRERKEFVHCPLTNCDEPIKGSWKELLTDKVTEEGLPIYKCPNCENEFTVNDVKVNALPVPDQEGDVFLFDTYSKKIIFRVVDDQKFTDGTTVYVHIPQNLLIKRGVKCFHFKAEQEWSNKDIENFIKNNETSAVLH